MNIHSLGNFDGVEPDSEHERISLLEQKFLSMGDAVSADIERHVQDPWLRRMVTMPFKLIQDNRENSVRSFNDFCCDQMCNPDIARQVVSNPRAMHSFQRTNPNQIFFRNTIDPSIRAHASFRGSCRLIALHRHLDSLAGQSFLYHELVHAAIDNSERSTIRSSPDQMEYLKWEYPDPSEPKFDLRSPDECWAMGLQIELLNILTDGRLAAGICREEYESFARGLGATDADQIGTMAMVAYLSTGYFNNRPTETQGCSDTFIQFYKDCMSVANRSVKDGKNHTPSAQVYAQSEYGRQIFIPGFVLLQAT